MTNKPNVTSKFDEERLRAAEQSQIVYLQGQIDELRRLIKDQSNKYSWAMEQVRKVEATAGQIQGLLERHRSDVAQSLDIARRDVATLRKEVAAALIKIEDATKPIREMQSQIHQVAEVRKQDRDMVAGWLGRIEDLERSIGGWYSQIKEADERHRALASRLDALYVADDAVRVDVRKVSEDLQVEKQSLRRQVVEAQQLVTELRPMIENYGRRIDRLDEVRHQIDSYAEQFPSQIVTLDVRITELAGAIKSVERQATERFLMNQERLEEVRHQQEEKLVTLQETDDLHLRQLTAWLDRIDGWSRELEQRQANLRQRFEEAYRAHALHLNDLEQRDGKLVEVMLNGLRAQLEQIRTEQIERGRLPPEDAAKS
jgi:chromosome segregation ATPase